MDAYYFLRDKTSVLGPSTIFGRQLSAAKFVEYNSIPYNFLSFKFSATASDQIMLGHTNIPLKGHKNDMRKQKTAF